jgi:uncharacterized protein (DUF2141 family)
MYKLVSLAAAAASLALIGAPAAAEAAIGPDAGACQAGSGKTAFLVNVSGFKATSGKVRVQVYGDNPADFLAKGKKLRRIDVPVTAARMPICIAVPSAGNYAIAVRHDVKNNGSDWNDGGGFSRNPKISLTSPKPKYGQVAVRNGGGVKSIDVVLQYRQGLTIGPVKKAG